MGLLGLLLWAWTPPAHAAPKDEARRHFAAGIAAIEAGDYPTGIAEFQSAYALVPHPVVLYNIARAYADIQDYPNAIAYFQQYLESDPIDRAEVEGFIATMEGRLQARALETATPGPTPSPTPTGGGGLATAAELAELERHARELQALAERLAERERQAAAAVTDAAVAAGEPTEGAGGETTPPPTPEEPLTLGGGGLVENLYERVVITASRFAQDPLNAPSAVTLITQDDIRMSAASSLPELLQTVPGMDFMMLTAANPELSIRGFNRRLSNKVLVLIDGRTVYLDFLGSNLWASLPISLEDIDRIEIIRGPGSAIYGANAFAGVINIITKAPGDPSHQDQATVAAGTGGYARGSATLSGREGRMAWRAGASTQQVGRWAQTVDLAQRPDVVSTAPDQDIGSRTVVANAQVDWRLTDKAFASVSGGFNQGTSEFYSIGALRNFWIDQRSAFARVDLGWGPLYLRSFYNRFDAQAESWYALEGAPELASTIESQVLDNELQSNLRLGAQDQHLLTLGVAYRLKTIDWDFLTPGLKLEHHVNAYIQDQSTFGPLTLSGALRLDRHPLPAVGLNPTVRVAGILRVGEGRALRLTGGNAFRTPTFLESYTDLYLSTGVDGVLVNTNGDSEGLEPEQIRAVELGFLDQSSDSWRAEAAVYGYQVVGLIDLSNISSGGRTLDYDTDHAAYIAGDSYFVNEDTTFWAAGGELVGGFFGVPGLDVTANYAFERIWSQEATAEGAEPAPWVVDRATATHKLNGVVAWRTPWQLDLSMAVSWYSDREEPIRSFNADGEVIIAYEAVPSYTILSNKVVWHPLGMSELDISFNAWNWLAALVGPHREYPIGQPVGPRFYGAASYRF